MPETSSIIPCGYVTSCYTDTAPLASEPECVSYINTAILSFLSTYYTCTYTSYTTTTTTTTTSTRFFEDAIMAIRNVAPLATAVAGSAVVIVRPLPLVNRNGIPPGNPIPGTPVGGSLPTTNSNTSQEALDLVPPGTIPVSIFPPYASPRTRPAVSVIFAEDPRIISVNEALFRFKRSLSRNSKRRSKKRKPLMFKTFFGKSRYASRLFSHLY